MQQCKRTSEGVSETKREKETETHIEGEGEGEGERTLCEGHPLLLLMSSYFTS